jgi:nicotinamidase-related amidase
MATTENGQIGLRFGAVRNWMHLCVDMQRMFNEPTEWRTPWMSRVLPNVLSIVELEPSRSLFTRFIPLRSADEGQGTWRRYYQRWHSMTLEELDVALVELVPELVCYIPPALVLDKSVMSPWHGDLHARLRARSVDTLIVTGAETEVCVLAAVMGGIDLGYRMIVVTDAICSSADETHDAMMRIYQSRFGMQVETISTSDLIAARLDGRLET